MVSTIEHSPSRDDLKIASSVLDELATTNSLAWSNPATRKALAAVAAWLWQRVRGPETAPTPETAAPLDLTEQLAALGREAARDLWVEHGGQLDAIPRTLDLMPWARHAYQIGLLECERSFTDPERRALMHAYRGELHVLASMSP